MNLTNKHICEFIAALPGGNVPQYAKLLHVTPQRLNTVLLNHKQGQKLVRAGLVCAAMKGMLPKWATHSTKRGVLTAENVPASNQVLTRILDKLPARYRGDAEHMFRTIIQMSTGNITFGDGFNELAAPYSELANAHSQMEGELLMIRQFNADLRESNGLLREQTELLHKQRLLSGPIAEAELVGESA